MFKQILVFSLLAISCKTSANRASDLQAAAPSAQSKISKVFDFTIKKNKIKDFGIDFFYSDYPAGQLTLDTGLPQADDKNPNKFYQLTQHYGEQGKYKGQVIGYSNRSDDVDTNIQVKIGSDAKETLKPNTNYLVTAEIAFVTNAAGGSEGAGAGGAPSATYFGTIVTQSPWAGTKEAGSTPTVAVSAEKVKISVLLSLMDQITDEKQQEEIGDLVGDRTELSQEEFQAIVTKYKLKVNGGSNSNGNHDAYVRTETKDSDGNSIPLRGPYGDCDSNKNPWICARFIKMGQISTGSNSASWTANSIKTLAPIKFKTDSSGNPIYVNVFSHSGFEGVTTYYLTALQIEVVETK